MIASTHLLVRPALPTDAADIARIYNQGIERRVATFETRLRTVEEILPWFDDARHPLLVAESGGAGETSPPAPLHERGERVVGWIHASDYRPRACYAGIGEFSVYVADEAQGMGVGSALMEAFLPACAEAGLWKVLSRIFVENTASRALCTKHGFREVGIYEKHAQLDGVWKDCVIVERLLP